MAEPEGFLSVIAKEVKRVEIARAKSQGAPFDRGQSR